MNSVLCAFQTHLQNLKDCINKAVKDIADMLKYFTESLNGEIHP